MGTVAAPDRRLLRNRYRQLRERIETLQAPLRPIHGEPHTGNFVSGVMGLHLIDFETACRGPVEWDLASLPVSSASYFEDVDSELLLWLRVLNSIRVATWCYTSRAPSMTASGRHHLDIVRASMADPDGW